MIEASKHRLLEWAFSAINRSMLCRAFHSLRVQGADHLRRLDRTRPVVVFANHSSWWDGLIEFYLSREVFRFDAYLIMDQEQMWRYSFFRWIGAFSVNRQSPREAVRSLQYAVELFDRPNRLLWIYPQGVMRPNDSRPLNFEGGVAWIAQHLENPQLLPLAHRYEFLRDQRPEAFLSFGPMVSVPAKTDPKTAARELESVLTEQLDCLRKAIAEERFDGFEVVLQGNRSTNAIYDSARGLEA
jgi:1-acyl-sn-glycerol-3-phosphate acyltransferase